MAPRRPPRYNDAVMSPASAPSDEDVLNFLAGLTRPASPREIATGLTLRHAGRRALPKILSRLAHQGLVQEARGRFQLQDDGASKEKSSDREGERPRERAGQRPGERPPEPSPKPSVRDPNLLTGRLVAHRDGYGFVVPETPRALSVSLYVSTKVALIPAGMLFKAHVVVDDSMNARISGLTCEGDEALGPLIVQFLRPALARYNGRTRPLVSFPAKDMQLHDVAVTVDDRLHLTAAFGT